MKENGACAVLSNGSEGGITRRRRSSMRFFVGHVWDYATETLVHRRIIDSSHGSLHIIGLPQPIELAREAFVKGDATKPPKKRQVPKARPLHIRIQLYGQGRMCMQLDGQERMRMQLNG